MFTEGDGAPRTSGDDAIVKKSTLWLIEIVKEMVAVLFQHQRARLQESWGTAIDQEEAVGYLVCDCLKIEILKEEARVIGKAAVLAITHPKKGAKVANDKLMGAAAAARSKARKAAEKDAEKAALLESKLKEIDENARKRAS